MYGECFTPYGKVEVKVIVANTNKVLSDVTFRVGSSGQFTKKYSGIALCTGGTHPIAVAIDKHTGRQSNSANAFKGTSIW
ncbi:MAG TPA: hypothetical protein VH482_06070 [Thermomicrobiales bacterium]